MSLPSSNTSFNRGPHFAVVVAVVRFTPANIGHDLSIEFGPQVVCDRALILYVITIQNALSFPVCRVR